MYIINKSEAIQRTVVLWKKQDIKPGEIVEVKENEWLYVTKAYGNIFWLSQEAKKRAVKKVISKK